MTPLLRTNDTPTRGDRAERWGLWHGYTANSRGIWRRGALICSDWQLLFDMHAPEIEAWECANTWLV